MKSKILLPILFVQIIILFGFISNENKLEQVLLEETAKSIKADNVAESARHIQLYEILKSNDFLMACATCKQGYSLKCVSNPSSGSAVASGGRGSGVTGGGGGGGINMQELPKEARIAVILDSPELTSTEREGIKRLFPQYNFEALKTEYKYLLSYKEIEPIEEKVTIKDSFESFKQDLKENNLYDREMEKKLNKIDKNLPKY